MVSGYFTMTVTSRCPGWPPDFADTPVGGHFFLNNRTVRLFQVCHFNRCRSGVGITVGIVVGATTVGAGGVGLSSPKIHPAVTTAASRIRKQKNCLMVFCLIRFRH